jgi:hypothetical protein
LVKLAIAGAAVCVCGGVALLPLAPLLHPHNNALAKKAAATIFPLTRILLKFLAGNRTAHPAATITPPQDQCVKQQLP